MPDIQTPIRVFLTGRPLPAVGPEDSVEAGVNAMLRCEADCTLVVDGARLLGIFTERDYLNRIVAEGIDAGRTRMREVMTPNPESLQPDDPISYAVNRMGLGRYRNIPIVDATGKPVAVLGVRDVIRHLSAVLREIEPRAAGGEPWAELGGG